MAKDIRGTSEVPCVKESQGITREKLQNALPKGSSAKVTDKVLDIINNMGKDTDLQQNLMEERLMSHINLLGKGNSIEELVNAVKFCTLKRFVGGITKAWGIVFPTKYDSLVRQGKQVSNFASMYNTTSLVVEIDTQMILPEYISRMGERNEMFGVLLNTARGNLHDIDGNRIKTSAHVMMTAAEKFLDRTAPPEESKVQLQVGLDEESKALQQNIHDQLRDVAKNQKALLESGKSIEDVQNLDIVIETKVVE